MGRRLSGRLEQPRSLGAPLTSDGCLSLPPDCQFVRDLCNATDRQAVPSGQVTRRYVVCASALGVLAAKSAHGVTGVATFILLADIGNQRFWTLHFDFEGGDQRVFRVNDNVSRFPLNFKTDRKLHLRALPLSASVAHFGRQVFG